MTYVTKSTKIASILSLSLLVGSITPIECFSVTSIPSKVMKGIGSGVTIAKDKTVDLATLIAGLIKAGVVKTSSGLKTGVTTSAKAIQTGTVKTVRLAKNGFDRLTLRRNHVKVLAGLIGLAVVLRFFTKEPSDNPIRFDKETLKQAFKDKQFAEIAAQIWYFIDDVLIGRAGKRASIRVTPDGKKLDVRPGRKQVGLGGNIHAYLPGITKALGFIVACDKFRTKSAVGLNAWTGYNSDKRETIEIID